MYVITIRHADETTPRLFGNGQLFDTADDAAETVAALVANGEPEDSFTVSALVAV